MKIEGSTRGAARPARVVAVAAALVVATAAVGRWGTTPAPAAPPPARAEDESPGSEQVRPGSLEVKVRAQERQIAELYGRLEALERGR